MFRVRLPDLIVDFFQLEDFTLRGYDLNKSKFAGDSNNLVTLNTGGS